MVAGLVCRLPVLSTPCLEDPLHLGRLFPGVLRFCVLAWEPSDNRSWLPAEPPNTF